MNMSNDKIAIIGLGYVGLPLAVEFGKKFDTIGFDLNKKRISDLRNLIDVTLEVKSENIKKSKLLKFTNKINDLKLCNRYIITVPTPVDKKNKPDLSFLVKATEFVAKVISKDDIVIYESTVYPGATEEVCVKIIERKTNLKINLDFFCGYSPERINPGDQKHTITNIKKVTSGSNEKTSKIVDNLYKKIIKAGTFRAKSIKVAEAAKVIENTQRDLNIALINELSIIFNRLDIDTHDVLSAASSKWNFLPFKPGLVGGHCIGVAPYYITDKSIKSGYTPKVILAGRKLNDSMGFYIYTEIKKIMVKKRIKIRNSNILILGITFKENCPDIRNSKVFDIYKGFKKNTSSIDVYDPWVNSIDTKKSYGFKTIKKLKNNYYDVVILAVAHDIFRNIDKSRILKICKKDFVVYDIKNLLPRDIVDKRL